MSNIKIGKIGLGAKLYSVDGKEFMLLKEYVDRRLSDLTAISEIHVGAAPQETTLLWFDTTEEPHSTEEPTVVNNTGYVLSDFGENAINNHNGADAWHSEKCQTIFNYVTKDFRDKCTSFQTYNNTFFGFGMIPPLCLLDKSSAVNADIIFTPYVNAAYWMNSEYGDFVLPVGSHYDNAGTDGDLTNSDRHDITASPDIFLTNSIAVAARRDTPEEWDDPVTSFGNGLEFIQDCSPEALYLEYPDKDIPIAFAELLSEDGINLTSTVHLTFSQYVEVGEEITIRRTSDEENWEKTIVSEIVSENHIRVVTPITPITTPSIYGWHDTTLGGFVGGQAQSWAVPLVAGKLKVIKMTTNSDWDTVRMAARATAKRNPTSIPEIDNSDWDIYRGFGCIDVQAAINYINN